MKSQKGITMVSLAIYIALIFIAIAMLATITANIQNSVTNVNDSGDKMAEVNKFNMYFIQETKNEENSIEEITATRIVFSSGKEFYYDSQSKSIKLIDGTKTIEIAKNIDSCIFTKKLDNGKDVITVHITPQGLNQITNDYVLNMNNGNDLLEDEQNYIKNNENQNVATE